MLSLTDHGSGVFSIPDNAFNLQNVGSKSGLSPWTPGLKAAGWNKGVILTDGEADASLLGHTRVDAWDNREGYTVLPYRQFRLSLYEVGELDAIFIGPVTGKASTYSASIECEHVAVPTSSILAGFTPSAYQSSFHSPIEAFASVRKGKTPIPHHRLDPSSTHVSFIPTEPLTRAEWFRLGYWIATAAASTTEDVVELIDDDTDKARYLSIAAPSLSQIQESGIQFLRTMGVRANSPDEIGNYQFESFTVVDPLKAAELWPPAAQLLPGTRVEPATEVCDMLFVTPDHMGSIEPIHISIRYSHRSEAFVIPKRYIRLRPGKHLEATSDGFSKTLWFATKGEAEHLIHVDTAAATYGKLAAQELRYSVYVAGERWEDFYCKPEDLATLPTESERLAQLEAQYGRKMPAHWQHCVEKIPQLLEYTDRASEGWLPLYEMEHTLGIDSGTKSLERWAEHFKFSFVQHPYQGTKIYAPISFDSLVEHPDFSAFLDVVFGRSAGFARRCILDDRARVGAGAQQGKAAP